MRKRLEPLLFSWVIDPVLIGLFVMKISGLLIWPWWRVTFPIWGALVFLVAIPVTFNLLRGIARMATGR